MRIGEVIAMAALVVVILVTLILAGNLQTIAETMDLGTAGNTTRTQLFSNTYTGLQLASVAIIIVAAVGILGLVISSLGRASGVPIA